MATGPRVWRHLDNGLKFLQQHCTGKTVEAGHAAPAARAPPKDAEDERSNQKKHEGEGQTDTKEKSLTVNRAVIELILITYIA